MSRGHGDPVCPIPDAAWKLPNCEGFLGRALPPAMGKLIKGKATHLRCTPALSQKEFTTAFGIILRNLSIRE